MGGGRPRPDGGFGGPVRQRPRRRRQGAQPGEPRAAAPGGALAARGAGAGERHQRHRRQPRPDGQSGRGSGKPRRGDRPASQGDAYRLPAGAFHPHRGRPGPAFPAARGAPDQRRRPRRGASHRPDGRVAGKASAGTALRQGALLQAARQTARRAADLSPARRRRPGRPPDPGSGRRRPFRARRGVGGTAGLPGGRKSPGKLRAGGAALLAGPAGGRAAAGLRRRAPQAVAGRQALPGLSDPGPGGARYRRPGKPARH